MTKSALAPLARTNVCLGVVIGMSRCEARKTAGALAPGSRVKSTDSENLMVCVISLVLVSVPVEW